MRGSDSMMQYVCDELELLVEIENKAIKQIQAVFDTSVGIETGGILIGYYTVKRDKAVITELSETPSDSKCGVNWFHRGIEGLKKLLVERWKTRDEYYLGEWHIHPFSRPMPSGIDRMQRISISKDKRFNCTEPIMLIIGGGKQLEISISLVFRGGIYTLESCD